MNYDRSNSYMRYQYDPSTFSLTKIIKYSIIITSIILLMFILWTYFINRYSVDRVCGKIEKLYNIKKNKDINGNIIDVSKLNKDNKLIVSCNNISINDFVDADLQIRRSSDNIIVDSKILIPYSHDCSIFDTCIRL
jgi:hypothetical protein